jgi:hypothetical protein
MHKIEITENNFLTVRPTPWDTRNFGFTTNEIMEFKFDNPSHLDGLLRMLNTYNKEREIKFTYTRINADDKLLKRKLQESGFYYAETTFHVVKKDFQKYIVPSSKGSGIILEHPEEQDFIRIKEIVRDDFFYGRFHEDPYIDVTKAKTRYVNWINDLILQKKEFVVFKKGGNVLAFYAYSVDCDKCDLILGGVSKEKSMISYFFWAAVLESLKKRGVSEARTVISAANIPVVNLYSYFGFKLEKTLVGFHKLYMEDVDE